MRTIKRGTGRGGGAGDVVVRKEEKKRENGKNI